MIKENKEDESVVVSIRGNRFKKILPSLSRRNKIVTVAVLLVVVGLVGGYIMFRPKSPTPVPSSAKSTYPPIQEKESGKDDNFTNQHKQPLNKDSNQDQLLGRIKLANYYFNTYKIDKVLEELAKIKEEFPEAEQYQEYLVSLFGAYAYKNDQANMTITAKKIVQLSKSGKSYEHLVVSAEKQSIEEAAKR